MYMYVCMYVYMCRCCVVGIAGERMDLSLRPSRVHGDIAGAYPDQEIASLEDLPEGTIVRGFVKAVTDVGVFIRYHVMSCDVHTCSVSYHGLRCVDSAR